MFTSDRTIRWIENLADQELLIKSGEKGSFDITATKEEVLSAETSAFIRDLLQHFEYLVRLFNARVEKKELQIKLERNPGVFGGFNLDRNHMRFTLCAHQPGKIQLQCNKLIKNTDGGSLKPSVMFTAVIESKFGNFHDVEWLFLSCQVNAEQVARHYLTEFIQTSRTSH